MLNDCNEAEEHAARVEQVMYTLAENILGYLRCDQYEDVQGMASLKSLRLVSTRDIDLAFSSSSSHSCSSLTNSPALFQAVVRNLDDSILNILLGQEYGEDVNRMDERGWRAVLLAAYHGHAHLVKTLVEKHHAEIHGVCLRCGLTALHLAVIMKRIDVIEILVKDFSVNVNVCTRDGVTPLMLAASHGNDTRALDILLSVNSIDRTMADVDGMTAFMYASQEHSRVAMERVLSSSS